MSVSVGIVGGTGFTGGELLRLLHTHPQAQVTQITSRSEVGKYVYNTHPNMRGATDLQFIHPDTLEPCDVLFLCLPHKTAAGQIDNYAAIAERIIDLSADFRLNSTTAYEQWYGEAHPAPVWLDRFVYGLPEANRDDLGGAAYASGVGCNATTVNLALMPLARAGLLESVAAELKVGSSEGGAVGNAASHHPIRSGAVRAFRPTGHRHTAEVQQVLGADIPVHFSVTGIEMVRGVHLLAHCTLTEPVEEKTIWKTYRRAYKKEPFIRFVNSKTGLHRLPEPRVVAGTNFCDIGFELDAHDPTHLVVIAALDNLVKGAAGSAVQCMNLMCGFDEADGLTFTGIYP
jgi:N-acetyl-gamma-glutamyl-phosphate/LysW-gamma-L-alpha-aminoadipyl-6-phosphate reductase